MANLNSLLGEDVNLGVPDADGLVWKQLRTKGGKDFQVGWRHSDAKATFERQIKDGHPTRGLVKADDGHLDAGVTAAATEATSLKAASTSPPDYGFVPVNWTVGNDDWIDTDQAVKDEGVKRYKLYFNGHPNVYSYTLEFTNTKGWSYHFIDDAEKHDCYGVETWVNGDHWVKYNSDSPTIKFVKEGGYCKIVLSPHPRTSTSER